MQHLLREALDLQERRRAVPSPPHEGDADFVRDCLIQFHGHCGIAIVGHWVLTKDLKVIAKASMGGDDVFRLTVYWGGRPYSVTTTERRVFAQTLVEGMSYHV